LTSAARTADKEITKTLGMHCAPDEGFVMAVIPSSAARLAKIFDLGVEYALDPGASHKLPVRWSRIVVCVALTRRMPHLVKVGALGIYTLGVLLAAHYGAEHQAIPIKAIQPLRPFVLGDPSHGASPPTLP
jgi:hypothetical protein